MRVPTAFALTLVLAVSARAQPAPQPGADGLPSRWARAPQLDLARVAMGVDLAWERFGLSGRGATVCIVDTGVDLTHDDLRDAVGATRVQWLLDLDASPLGLHPELEARFPGAVWSRSDIDRGLDREPSALPTDWHGHGTAMASAAAGDGAAAGADGPGPGAGVAPHAALIIVRALRRGSPGFADPDVVRGIAFCAAVGTPGRTVALLALGGHDGAHDGSEPLEQALAGFVRRGLPIVVAAGNDSSGPVHAAARVPRGSVERVTVHVPSPDVPTDAHVALAVRGARGLSVIAPDGARTPASAGEARVEARGPSAYLRVDATRPDVLDVVILGDARTPLRGGDYVLEIAGPSTFDAWIVSESLGSPLFGAALVGRSVLAGDEVTIPATSEPVVAVGSSVSRSFLPRPDGGPGLTLEADEEGRALFSAIGPAASGAPRPDVLAPGGWIVAALSSRVVAGDEENLFHGDAAAIERHRREGDRVAVAGTSVSAALVAGLLALAVEAAPARPERERALLAFTARRDASPFTPRRGFGLVDAVAFLDARARPDGAPCASLSLAASRAYVTPAASDLGIVVLGAASDGAPADGWVTLAREGVEVVRAPLVAGIARARVPVGRVPVGGVLTLTASAGEATAHVEVPVTLDEDGAPSLPAGGASCAARPSSTEGGAAPLLLLALVLRARRRQGRQAGSDSVLRAT